MPVSKNHFVVAIGASAGGLEAIHEFFDNMTETQNLSFVIIQHLSSDYKSLLVDLVSRHTSMKVYEAENNTPVEKKCIYVIPNNKFITIEGNRLILEEKKSPHAPNNAIDTFLYSLARDKKNKAIAIILSGTGTDGTKGIDMVKNNGGLVIIQDPSTAKFNGMPNSAIQLGVSNIIVAPSAMPAEILNYIQLPLILQNENFSTEALSEIFQLIHKVVGHDFHYYKLPTIERRIARRMIQTGYKRLEDYIELLRKDDKECRHLGNDFLIGVTRFFRDREAFEELKTKVIAPLVEEKQNQQTIKVWICACSTGEEVYSVAMLLADAIAASGKQIDYKIFATDVDEMSIDIAAKGCYPLLIERDIDAAYLSRYFVNRGSQYQIIPSVRKQIIFAKHDVIKDPPFINNDLVICRNMLIYISSHLQQKIFSLLLFSLNKSGYLFLGSSEHSNFIREYVTDISSKWKIYQKNRNNKLSSQYLAQLPERNLRSRTKALSSLTHSERPSSIWDALKTAMSDILPIAAFYIDNTFNIKESVGNYEEFLTLPKKSLQLNLLNMVPEELYFIFSTEIKRAWKDEEPVTLHNLKHQRDGQVFMWQLYIKPSQPYTLVVITQQSVQEMETAQVTASPDTEVPKERYVLSLERELEELRTNLNLAVQDLETANEELQSGNEELQSANEELQSSNEELQSLNEELHTLNTEHQLKIKELIELNDDLNNYFRSTDIAQIFLDEDLNIRKYNPASARMINFIDTDLGRPIYHISHNIRHRFFLQDVEEVMKTGKHIEKEVHMANGKNMLMRILPYLNRDKEQKGIIITFIDITTITELNNTVRSVLNSSPGVIMAFRAERVGAQLEDLVLQTANDSAGTFLKKPSYEFAGTSLKSELSFLATEKLMEQFRKVIDTDCHYQTDLFLDVQQKWFTLIAVKLMDGIVLTLTDITTRKLAERKLRKNYQELITVKDKLKNVNQELETNIIERTRELTTSEERFRLLARATNDALYDWDLVNDDLWLGEVFFSLFGFDENRKFTNRKDLLKQIHPEDREAVTKSLFDAINTGQSQWSKEYRFEKADGVFAYILERAYILHDEYGTPYRMLGSMFDATQLKHAEHQLTTMNEQLEQKVVQRTRELEQINSNLESSNNDLQQFASVASHDLQEPLRKIQIFSHIVIESLKETADDKTIIHLQKIVQSSDRMRALINDILHYSRLSESDNAFRKTDLNELLHSIVEDFEVTIEEKKAVIEIDRLPEIEAIPALMRQVFQNLISNALKFALADVAPHIQIKGSRLAKKSFMSMEQADGPYLMVSVKDNGIGFPPEFSEKVFSIFQRLHSRKDYEGTGIGLAITRKIIEKHQGVIRADSKEHHGATFNILLPLQQS